MKSAKQHVTKVVKKKCSGVRNTIFVSKYGRVEVNRKKMELLVQVAYLKNVANIQNLSKCRLVSYILSLPFSYALLP